MRVSERRARTRHFGWLSKGLPLLLVTLAGFVIFAPAAFANNASLTASAQCPDVFAPNTYTVSYTSTSWASGVNGSNSNIHVEYSINGGSFALGDQFAFPNQATVPSQSGTFTVSSATTITSLMVRAQAFADWGGGGTEHGPWDLQTLTLPTGCQPPASPSALTAMSCVAGGALVTVTNGALPGGEPVAFTVASPAGTSPAFSQTTAPIGPGGSAVVTVPFVENETRTITVTTPGGFSKQFSNFKLDCQRPGALVSHACAPSGLDVTATNTGDEAGTFSINGTSQLVPAGQSFTTNVPVAENASVQVSVLLDGVPVEGSPFGFFRDCQRPAVSVSHACAASGLDVTVTNTGDDVGTFSINGTSQLVPAGQSFTTNVAVNEGASVQVMVLLDGNEVAGSPFTFLRDCQHPAAAVSHECAAIGVDVTVTNTGDDSGTFSINGTLQVVAPGQSFTENVAVEEGDSVQVTVLLDGNPVTGSPFTFLRDCEQPGAAATSNCSEAGADFVFTNSGESPTTLTVTKNGVPIDSVVVGPGSAVFKSYPLAEDEVAIFRVTRPGFDSGTMIVTHDCVQVSDVVVVRVAPPTQPVQRLAFTGASTAPLAIAGGLFLCIGILAVLASRKQHLGRR